MLIMLYINARQVTLPTREVLRRYKDGVVQQEQDQEEQTAQSNKSTHPIPTTTTTNTTTTIDSRTSQVARDLLHKATYQASIPTKEMEVMEWEQALFRATKRALARAKQPSQRTRQMIKIIKRSCTLHTG